MNKRFHANQRILSRLAFHFTILFLLSYSVIAQTQLSPNPNDGTISVESPVFNDKLFKNNGLINNWDFIDNYLYAAIYNYGIIDNKVTGTINNDGTIDNTGTGTINNDGTIENTGTVYNHVTIDNDGTIDNEGTINNHGIIGNDGTIDNDGTITNWGNINNDDTIDNSDYIKNFGTIDNSKWFRNRDTIDNNGNIESSGFIENTGTIDNWWSFNNLGTINNSGLIENNHIIDNRGTFINSLTIDSTSGNFNNYGILKGTGTFIGDLNNDTGTVAPGNSAGTMTIDGDFTLDGSGILDIEIGGFAAGTFDLLDIKGTAYLPDGNINFSFLPVYDIVADVGPGETWKLSFLTAASIDSLYSPDILFDFSVPYFKFDVFQQGNELVFEATNLVPIPSTVILGIIGLAVASWKLRRGKEL